MENLVNNESLTDILEIRNLAVEEDPADEMTDLLTIADQHNSGFRS
jgi:hypothetical protein